MGELTNCRACGAVFVKFHQPLCRSCHEKEEQWYRIVSAYLRKRDNRMATQRDIIEATSVPSKTLSSFIRNGRLLLKHYPNLYHPCERCNEPTQEPRFCTNCANELKKVFLSDTKTKDAKIVYEKEETYSLNKTLKNEE